MVVNHVLNGMILQVCLKKPKKKKSAPGQNESKNPSSPEKLGDENETALFGWKNLWNAGFVKMQSEKKRPRYWVSHQVHSWFLLEKKVYGPSITRSTPWKLTWQWKNNLLMMYLLYSKNGDFHCHVGWLEENISWQTMGTSWLYFKRDPYKLHPEPHLKQSLNQICIFCPIFQKEVRTPISFRDVPFLSGKFDSLFPGWLKIETPKLKHVFCLVN